MLLTMEILKLEVGELSTNCYIPICTQTNQCLIIDPGDNANYISEKILYQDLKPKTIIATHGHYDHNLASSELQMAFEIPFRIHQKDESLLKRIKKSAQYWTERQIYQNPPKINSYLKNDEKILFGKEFLKVMHAPGHTPGGIVLYNTNEKILLSGDTIFANGIGRTDFSYSRPEKMKKTLKKIRNKFKGYTVYPGHGNEFIL